MKRWKVERERVGLKAQMMRRRRDEMWVSKEMGVGNQKGENTFEWTNQDRAVSSLEEIITTTTAIIVNSDLPANHTQEDHRKEYSEDDSRSGTILNIDYEGWYKGLTKGQQPFGLALLIIW